MPVTVENTLTTADFVLTATEGFLNHGQQTVLLQQYLTDQSLFVQSVSRHTHTQRHTHTHIRGCLFSLFGLANVI